MAQYLICYDLVKADQKDYDSLEKKLVDMEAEPLQKSVWRVYADKGSAEDIFKVLKKRLKKKDRLLVSRIVPSDSYDCNLIEGITINDKALTLIVTK